jgi:hypothetical protein
MYLHDPADANVEQSAKSGATTTTWTALEGYGSFQVCAMFKEGTSMIELSIYAATTSTGTNATEIKTSGAILCDAEGDWAMQECTAEEINAAGRALGYAFTHVAAYIDCGAATDEVAVVYILDDPLFKYDALTPATPIA